jgi:putative membrane protein
LALAGALVLISSRRKDWSGLFIAAALGFLAEIVGVRTGIIFSPYRYTDVLQPQFMGAPVVMLCAWMTLVAYCRQLVLPLNLPWMIEAILAALWMTAVDLLIDPLAADRLNYWRWERPGAYYGIPLHNFAGWFGVSLFIFLVSHRNPAPNPVARWVGMSIALFFTFIAFSFGLILVGCVGLSLAALGLALYAAQGAKAGVELPAYLSK